MIIALKMERYSLVLLRLKKKPGNAGMNGYKRGWHRHGRRIVKMDYESAKETCHVRSGIYRTGDPVKVFTQDDLKIIHPSLQDINKDRIGSTTPKVYWKNHSIAFDERVPDEDKTFDDWEEYDPRDQPECSAFNEMPA